MVKEICEILPWSRINYRLCKFITMETVKRLST
jgi:hypothetical protein